MEVVMGTATSHRQNGYTSDRGNSSVDRWRTMMGLLNVEFLLYLEDGGLLKEDF